jgi:sulfide:quinone oxidoreductase
MGKTVVVLGAGIGGIVAAEELRRRLAAEHRVVAVERERTHVFSPSLLWYVTRPLDALRRRGVELVTGEITRLDPRALTVDVNGKTIGADALVVALGADYAAEAVPGLAEAGYNLYSLDGSARLRQALQAFAGGRIAVLTAAQGYKCPAAPYEAAMLIEAHVRRRGLREKTRICVHAAEPAPMPVAGQAAGAQIVSILERKGIEYFPQRQVTRVEPGVLHFTQSAPSRTEQLSADFDLLVYVPPHRAPAVVRDTGLCGESGWIPVDRHTLATSLSGVWAIGDVTSIPLKMGRPLPKAGVFAAGQARVVARNIAHAWTGRGAAASFDGHGFCFLETGGAMAGIGSGNFYAEPLPDVRLRSPNPLWHLGKLMFEKYWLGSRL